MNADALNIIHVSDLADPRLADFANLKDRELRRLRGEERRMHGALIAEGETVVRLLLASRFPVRAVLLTEARLAAIAPDLRARGCRAPVYIAPAALMNAVVGFDIHRGILASADRVEPTAVSDLLGAATSVLVLEDLTNLDNIGGLFRTASALGGERPAVLLSPRCVDPLYRKAIRVSMGHVLYVPFAVAEPWPAALGMVRSAGFTLIALTTDGADLRAARPPARPALLLGTEGHGLSPEASAAADMAVRIPMRPGVDSLNVNVAAAVAMFEFVAR